MLFKWPGLSFLKCQIWGRSLIKNDHTGLTNISKPEQWSNLMTWSLLNDLVSIRRLGLSFLKCQIWGRSLIKNDHTGLTNISKPEQQLQRPVSIKRSDLYFLNKTLLTTSTISISNSRSLEWPGLIIESLEYRFSDLATALRIAIAVVKFQARG